jgi:hypothetical protein
MYNNILNSLNNFILIGNNLNVDFYNDKFKNQPINHEQSVNREPINREQPVNREKLVNQNKNDIFIVRQKDTLFWTFYIMKYGLFNYEMNVFRQSGSFRIEKEEKFKCIDLIRENKELLKLHKIKNLQSLENELANENIISIKTFICMCIIENLNVYLINDRKLHMNVLDDTLPINIIFKNKNKPYYCIDFQVSEEKINNYKENYLIMSSFDNNLKSINSYKVNELLDICRKLDLTISSDEKLNKKDLYELISKNY